MSSTISAHVVQSVTVVKTFSQADAGNPDVTFTTGNVDEVLTAGTTVTVSKHADFTKTLSTGTGTIDLTSLPGDGADTEVVNGTGLKVQVLHFTNPSTNANKITVSNGASNPYRIDGATTTWTIPLAPGQSAQLRLVGAGDVIGGSNKTIDLVGTGSQTLKVRIVMG